MAKSFFTAWSDVINAQPKVRFARLDDVQDDVDTDDRSQPSQVYGETAEQLFPKIIDRCEFSPTGEHVYAGPGGFHCRWCRQPSGLDR